MMHYTNYDPADRDGWLALRQEHRKHGVGGSEIASIAGVPGAYGSAYSEWADRVGAIPPRKLESAYLDDGRDIEAIVARRFEEASGMKIRHRYAIITNDACPHLFANVDGFVEGEDMGWEGKTYDVRSSKFDDGVPPAYVSQVAVYMAVTEKRRWVLSAWAYGQGTKHFYFTMDPDDAKPDWAAEKVVLGDAELEAAEMAAADFMRLVENRIAPAPDGSEATAETLKAMYPRSESATRDLTAYKVNIEAIKALEAEIKDLERQKEEQRQVLMEAMGVCDTGTADGWKVTWKLVETKRLDTKAALAGVGEVLLTPFMKTTTARTLRIAKAK